MEKLGQIIQTQIKGTPIGRKVIHENLHYILNRISKDGKHAPFEGG